MKQKSRNINIEALRILLLLMVVVIHTLSYQLSISTKLDGTNIIFTFLYTLSRPAVNTFILISGYYSFGKINFEYSTLLKKTLFPVLAYIPVIALYSIIFDKGHGLVKSVLLTVYNLVSLDGLFFHLWYIVCYILLFLLIPYINTALASITKKQYLLLIGLSSILFIVFSSINDFAGLDVIYGYTGKSFTDMGVFNFTTFFPIYLIGAYFGKYQIRFKLSTFWYLALSAVTATLTIFYTQNITPLNFVKSVLLGKQTSDKAVFYQAFLKYNSIFLVLASVFLFMIFIKLNITVFEKIIIQFSGCVMGAYVIHMVILSFTMKLLNSGSKYPFYTTKISSSIRLILIIFITFLLSLLIEYFRKEVLMKQIMKRKNLRNKNTEEVVK